MATDMSNKTTVIVLLIALVVALGWSTAFIVDETKQVIITYDFFLDSNIFFG